MNDITVILADDDEINNYLSVSVIGEFVAAGQIFALISVRYQGGQKHCYGSTIKAIRLFH